MSESPPFSSAEYWEARYQSGGLSGSGSAGRLARFKAGVVNGFIAANAVQSVIDLGCGDGSQLALLELPADYTGIDVSRSALQTCAARFPDRRFATPEWIRTMPQVEMTLSLDVLFHLVEDPVYDAILRAQFSWASRFVMIYASNRDESTADPHVRHRHFTSRVAAIEPDWRLMAHLPNPFPYNPDRPDDTSFADFFIFGRDGTAGSIVVPDLAV